MIIPLTQTAIVVPHTSSSSQPAQQSQQSATGCKYSVRIDRVTTKCLTEEEYNQHQAQEDAIARSNGEAIGNFFKDWWWAFAIGAVACIAWWIFKPDNSVGFYY